MLTIKKLIEEELFIQCPLISSDRFLDYCKKRDISVTKEKLELYEKLEIFYPIARVEVPKFKVKVEYVENGTKYRDLGALQEGEEWSGDAKETYGHFWWEKNIAKEFYSEGFLWSPEDRPFMPWNDFYDKELMYKKIESFYSIFQIYHLLMIEKITSLKLSLACWSTYDEETIENHVLRIKDMAKTNLELFKREENFEEEINSVCQIISNRYFPETQTDRRTINVSNPSHYHDWSWWKYCREWNPAQELFSMGMAEDRIKKYQEIMAVRARTYDPIEDWHDLVQFVSVEKKKRLKKEAQLAQSFYAMEMMLRLFYKDLTGVDLSEEKGINYKWRERVYGEGVPDSNMLFLECLANQFHLNPRPKLILVVEGESEYQQIPRLAEAIGPSFDTLGIRIEHLGGIGEFTSGKVERFIDHYHNLQTIVYLMLDNENNAVQFKNKTVKRKSKYSESKRYITSDDYIFLWDTCFELDNFSDSEIAYAMSSILDVYSFTENEIAECRENFGKQGDIISSLFKTKTNMDLNKPLLAERLIDNLIEDLDNEFIKGKPKRKLIKKLEEIVDLARKNYQPHSFDIWKENQASGYIGRNIE